MATKRVKTTNIKETVPIDTVKVADDSIKPYIGDRDDPLLDDFVISGSTKLQVGFRIRFHTYWDCARSIFMIHNETVNIWSHLLGAIFFFALGIYILVALQPSSMHNANIVQRWT